jgi:hypothetical protein
MKMNIPISLAIFGIIICSCLSIKDCGNNNKRKTCCPFSKKKPAIMYFTVDNVSAYYSINGVKTLVTSSTAADWTQTETANVLLAPGDTVCINGYNVPFSQGNPGNSSTNPAAMIASIHYYDYNGNYVWMNTDNNWLCDGVSAKRFNQNKDTSSIWWNVKKANISGVQPNAWWIWNDAPWSATSSATCCVTLPCCINKYD